MLKSTEIVVFEKIGETTVRGDPVTGDDGELEYPTSAAPLWRVSFRTGGKGNIEDTEGVAADDGREHNDGDTAADGTQGAVVTPVEFAALEELPLSDAVGLLSGSDSTGMMLWDGSRRLCERLARWLINSTQPLNRECDVDPQFPDWALLAEARLATSSSSSPSSGAVVIELGCGCGVVSFVAARLLPTAARVFATDASDECLGIVRHNAAIFADGTCGVPTSGGGRVEACRYVWGDPVPAAVVEAFADRRTRSVHILAAEVLYNGEAADAFAAGVTEIGKAARTAASSDGTLPIVVTLTLEHSPRSWTLRESSALLHRLRALVEAAGWRVEGLLESPSGAALLQCVLAP